MAPSLSSPDIETILPPRLKQGLTTLRAWTVSVGRTRGTKVNAVTIQRAGGQTRGKLDYPRLLINVFAANDGDANDLANDVVTVLESIRGSHPIVKIEIDSGPSAIENPEEKQRVLSANAIIIRTSI